MRRGDKGAGYVKQPSLLGRTASTGMTAGNAPVREAEIDSSAAIWRLQGMPLGKTYPLAPTHLLASAVTGRDAEGPRQSASSASRGSEGLGAIPRSRTHQSDARRSASPHAGVKVEQAGQAGRTQAIAGVPCGYGRNHTLAERRTMSCNIIDADLPLDSVRDAVVGFPKPSRGSVTLVWDIDAGQVYPGHRSNESSPVTVRRRQQQSPGEAFTRSVPLAAGSQACSPFNRGSRLVCMERDLQAACPSLGWHLSGTLAAHGKEHMPSATAEARPPLPRSASLAVGTPYVVASRHRVSESDFRRQKQQQEQCHQQKQKQSPWAGLGKERGGEHGDDTESRVLETKLELLDAQRNLCASRCRAFLEYLEAQGGACQPGKKQQGSGGQPGKKSSGREQGEGQKRQPRTPCSQSMPGLPSSRSVDQSTAHGSHHRRKMSHQLELWGDTPHSAMLESVLTR